MENVEITTNYLKNKMAYCYGTEHYYISPFYSFKYTDGIKVFCDTAKAYWLFDILESIIKSTPKINDDLISIELSVNENNTALITFKNYKEIIFQQNISYTDCPQGTWLFFYEYEVFFWHGEY